MRPLEQRYAQALFELTQEEAQFRSDTEFLTGDSSLWKVLCSPCVSTAEKHALLERLLRDKTTPLLLNFYRLLCDRERIFLLPRMPFVWMRSRRQRPPCAVPDLLRKRTGSSCPRRSAGSTGKIVWSCSPGWIHR